MRFGLSAAGFNTLDQLIERARWAERVGFSTFSVSDHLNAHSPFVMLQAISDATSRIRLGTLVINNDLRHPVVLAQDAATVDRLSGGRLELGLGAGWAFPEYRRAGIAYEAPGLRIERLRETVEALRALFGGDVLTTAGKHLQLQDHFLVPTPPQGRQLPLLTGFSPDRHGENVRTHFTRSGLADRAALVGRLSAGRTSPPERNVLLQMLVVTDDREYLARTIAQRRGQSFVEVLTCPFLAFGTLEEICAQLRRLRDDFGIGYVTVFDQSADDAAKVIAALDRAG
jgi:alkanesulfonate monooxygenase SsuD/methylene tetrahydromethanopterin reductase-like flavin-dependent oxidoreductase (luciferase family)